MISQRRRKGWKRRQRTHSKLNGSHQTAVNADVSISLRGARHATNVYKGPSSFVLLGRGRKFAPVFAWSVNPNRALAQQARFASRRRRSIDVVKRSFLVFFKSRYGSHLATSECQVISVHTNPMMRAVCRWMALRAVGTLQRRRGRGGYVAIIVAPPPPISQRRSQCTTAAKAHPATLRCMVRETWTLRFAAWTLRFATWAVGFLS